MMENLQENLNGIGAQPTPQPVVKETLAETLFGKQFRDLTTEERKVYNSKYYLKNKEKIDAQNKRWRRENPDKCNALSRSWAKKNPDKIRSINKKWVQENCDKVNAMAKKWRQKNPVKVNLINLKRRGVELKRGTFNRKNLFDVYIKDRLRKSGFYNPSSEMISAKRLQLFLRRYKLDKLDENQKQQLTNLLNQFKGEVKCT
ncbi:MAG: hypothetical protein IPL84_03965 [Chitinophagaceae bacterium]|nr:hypothetical protein [Chitinophagaceae bacterium]